MRFHVAPRAVPPAIAARRLGLSAAAFDVAVAALEANGFPRPDAVTGHYDLDAIDRYIEARNPQLFGAPQGSEAVTDRSVIRTRLAALRQVHG